MHVHRYFPLYDALTSVMQRALCHRVLVKYKIHLSGLSGIISEISIQQYISVKIVTVESVNLLVKSCRKLVKVYTSVPQTIIFCPIPNGSKPH